MCESVAPLTLAARAGSIVESVGRGWSAIVESGRLPGRAMLCEGAGWRELCGCGGEGPERVGACYRGRRIVEEDEVLLRGHGVGEHAGQLGPNGVRWGAAKVDEVEAASGCHGGVAKWTNTVVYAGCSLFL
jgi:hypothetical protein